MYRKVKFSVESTRQMQMIYRPPSAGFFRHSKTILRLGTIKILDTCKEAELPEPEMQELNGGFRITLFKNTLTVEQLTKLGLNARQIKAVLFVKEKGRISNKKYQEVFGVEE